MMPDPGILPPEEVERIFQPLTTWLRIATDGTIEVAVQKAEMGQGVHTTLPLMIAEELDADLSKMEVKLVGELPPYSIPGGLPMTYGSTSVSSTYEAFRQVGAAARSVLMTAAAAKWNVSVDQIQTENGKCIHSNGQVLTYGELVLDAQGLDIPKDVPLKDASNFKLIGQSQPRLQDSLIVNGQCSYGADIDLPGRKFAALRHGPIIGSVPQNVSSLTSSNPAVSKIVELPNAVAVVADSFWTAKKVVEELPIVFSEPTDSVAFSSDTNETELTQAIESEGKEVLRVGDPDTLNNTDYTQLSASYFVPHLAHFPMEPVTATAHVTADKAEIWLPTQSAYFVRLKVESVTGLSAEQIIVHPTFIGGGFGRKADTDYVEAAVRIAMELQGPITLIWSREEDTRRDRFRPAFAGHLTGFLNSENKLAGWIATNAGPSVLGFGENDPLSIQGFSDLPYSIDNVQVNHINRETIVEAGFWRSIGHTQNTFFVESFLDELASAAGIDSLQFRLELLESNKRVQTVLQTAANLGRWGQPFTSGASQGVAVCADYGSVLALVCELTIDDENKLIKVHRLSAAVDCGFAIQPDGVVAQVQGGLLFGLSAALYEEITIKNGVVEQSNLNNYRILSPRETPDIEIEIINSGAEVGGMGEIAVGPVAPAVANAVFKATAKRLRRLPLHKSLFA